MRKITLLFSMLAFFMFAQAQTNVANIGALRTAIANLSPALAFGGTTTGTYTITGEVTLTFASTSASGVRTLYVQDATGAFMVYDSGKLMASTPNLYVGLTNLTGTVKSYNGILELILSVVPAAPTSPGNGTSPFAPIVTTLDQLINYPLQVATVKNVSISDISGGTGVFVASKNYPLSVGGVTSTTVLRTSYADVNYIGATVPTTAPQNITGLVLPYQSSATATAIVDLIPRSLSDFQVATGFTPPTADALKVSVTGKTLTVTNSPSSTVEIFNTVGAKVQSLELKNGSADLNLSKGLYIIRAGKATAKIML